MANNQRVSENAFYGTLGGLAGATGMAHYIANKRIQAKGDTEAPVVTAEVITTKEVPVQNPTTALEDELAKVVPTVVKANQYANTHTVNQALDDAGNVVKKTVNNAQDTAGGFVDQAKNYVNDLFESVEPSVLRKIDRIIEENLGSKIALGLGGGALGYMAGEHFSDDIGNMGKDIGQGLTHASNSIEHTIDTGKIGSNPSLGSYVDERMAGVNTENFAKNHAGLIGAGLAGGAAVALSPKKNR